ncbi:MAG: C-GCAxxG-C-C family protein [Desulfobacteraceae bacterium]|nr:C-GCAxxG-C-C family protein [Desulfobacteraceae bacterium]
MTSEDAAKRAQELFLSGFHCSQAVFAAIAEKFGMEPSEDVIAALSPFGGGIGCNGDVCGVLSGAVAAVGFLMGKRAPGQKDHKEMWRLSRRVVDAFGDITKVYGGPNCSDIARVDWGNVLHVRAFRKDPDSRRAECVMVMGKMAELLARLLERGI